MEIFEGLEIVEVLEVLDVLEIMEILEIMESLEKRKPLEIFHKFSFTILRKPGEDLSPGFLGFYAKPSPVSIAIGPDLCGFTVSGEHIEVDHSEPIEPFGAPPLGIVSKDFCTLG